MKEFIKKLLMLFGAAILFATIVPAIVSNHWDTVIFMLQLMLALLMICLLQLLTIKVPFKSIVLKYSVDIVMVLSVILFWGWIWGWYDLSYVWQMLAMVIPALGIGYYLDIIKVKKDVDIINKGIKHRRDKIRKEELLNECKEV